MNSKLFDEKETALSEKKKYFVQPGYIFASREPHLISTVLGSCVSVCIWDTKLRFGGMNHYVHAKPFKKERTAHFGSISIPYLIQLMIKLGSQKYNLRAHIIGGAQNPTTDNSCIGKQNAEIAKKLLKKHNIEIATFDSGDKMGRKIVFDSETGEIVVYKVNSLRENDWYDNKSFNNR